MPKKTSYKLQASKADTKMELRDENLFEKEKQDNEVPNIKALTLTSTKENDVAMNLINDEESISIINRENETEIIQFSSDDILETIQFEDATVEIVGFIDEIEGPKIVGQAQHYRLLKFMLNNNSNHRVQVVAWNNEVERIQHNLKPNRIIHVDGAKAKAPKNPNFNKGTLPYELIVRSNTVINNLGVFDLKNNINLIQADLIKFEDIPNYFNTCILLRGFIKTNFNTLSNTSKSCGYGSLTDGTHKIEVQIMEYENCIYFEKGDYVQVKGYVKLVNDVYYVNVEKVSDIKRLEDENRTLTWAQSLKATKPVTKRLSTGDNTATPIKIRKQ